MLFDFIPCAYLTCKRRKMVPYMVYRSVGGKIDMMLDQCAIHLGKSKDASVSLWQQISDGSLIISENESRRYYRKRWVKTFIMG